MTALERRQLEDARRLLDRHMALGALRQEIQYCHTGPEILDALGELVRLDLGRGWSDLRVSLLERIDVRHAEIEAELEALGFLDKAKAGRD